MYKYLRIILEFILPIFGKAVAGVAADELAKVAYPQPDRRKPRTYGSRDYSHLGFKDRPDYRNYNRIAPKIPKQRTPRYHDVLLVAFDVRGSGPAEEVQRALMRRLPEAEGFIDPESLFEIDSWWVANDLRFDRSDCDSAVFVKKGMQEEARKLLKEHGLAS